MRQAEVKAVLDELINNLDAATQSRVRGIPLVFENDPNEVNAYAGCDDNGSPFLAGTAGLLDAVDAMAQTQATDELYGTRTYDAYTNAVVPKLISQNGGSAALPDGIIAPQYLIDPRRLSRARELYDEIVAFTFGHELAHHYLGHTGCANGQPMTSGPSPARIGNLVTKILPGLNQPNEVAADNAGVIDVLATGKNRQSTGYRWTERGGVSLLDFFARMEKAAGISVWNPIGFFRTHPYPTLRLPLVQATANAWRSRNPG